MRVNRSVSAYYFSTEEVNNMVLMYLEYLMAEMHYPLDGLLASAPIFSYCDSWGGWLENSNDVLQHNYIIDW